jgi:hypothetical protein
VGARTADGDVDPADWPRLTKAGAKRRLYAQESLFRDSCADVHDVLGAGWTQALHGVAALFLRPDAIVGRRVERALALVRREGFVPMLAETVAVDRLASRHVWRYQLNVATLDRIAIGDLLAAASPWLVVLLVEEGGSGQVPASIRLSELKGVADFRVRNEVGLRSELEAPNGLMSFVHTPDEPADVVRDLGILMDRPERRALFARLGEPAPDATERALAVAAELEREHPAESFDREEALAAARAALDERLGDDGAAPHARRALDLLDRAQDGEPLPWRTFVEAVDAAGAALSTWPRIVLGSELSVLSRPGEKAIPRVPVEAWQAPATTAAR